jgi:outer membrane protein assembly factor BamE (lipoprotein component of BamABCDE complex)
MNRCLLLLVTLVSLGLASACTPTKITRGHHLEPEDIERISVGITTQQQVAQLLGSPSSVATFKGNSDTWYYISKRTEQYTELDESTVGQQVVAITFDAEGRVGEITNYDIKDSRNISYASRTTPTQGSKLTFLEQLFEGLLSNFGRSGG